MQGVFVIFSDPQTYFLFLFYSNTDTNDLKDIQVITGYIMLFTANMRKTRQI